MLTVIRELIKRGLSVDLLLAKREGWYVDLVPDRARVITLDAPNTVMCARPLYDYVVRESPDALLATLNANAAALLAKKFGRLRIRTVVRFASTFSAEYKNAGVEHRLVLRVTKHLFASADAVIAVSLAAAEDLRKAVPKAASKIRCIYNPVVGPEIAEQAKLPAGHPWLEDSSLPVILTVGRLIAEKDHITLLQAFSKVTKRRPARLLILGEGPNRDKLLSVAAELGIAERVDLPGFRTNPYAFMARARVFVLSSLLEGLPAVLIEAMACRTPVVSTDCPSGPAEILEGGKWGPLVPVGDSDAMAEAILTAMDRPGNGASLEKRAKEFSVGSSVDRYLEALFPRGLAC